MAKQKKPTQEAKPMSAIERLGMRVSAMINAPNAQKLRVVTIHRLDTDPDDAWDEVIGSLAETDGVDVALNDDGSVLVTWARHAREDEAW